MGKNSVSPVLIMEKENDKPPLYKKSSSKKFNREEMVDRLGEELRLAIWPNYDYDKFVRILGDWPDLLNVKSGQMQETLLHRACRYGSKAMVVTLIEKGASPCVGNARGVTPLHLACQFRHYDITKMLLEHDAQVDEKDDQGNEPIHSAAKSGCVKSVNLLVEWGAYICSPGHLKNTVLHYAAKMGRLGLVAHLLKIGCPPNLVNRLRETPLHLAASVHTKDNEHNVSLIECLLEAGAQLDARTEWGDTAVHYAARWGTDRVLEHLLDRGIPVDKPTGGDHSLFFEKNEIPPDLATEYGYSLLQKVAKSTCTVKSTLMMDRIMTARNILTKNMYYSTRGTGDEDIIEMNQQQVDFLKMSAELYEDEATVQMFLKHCPEALLHLFDLCVVKPDTEQVQGTTYFDFFLFTNNVPHEDHHHGDSELRLVDNLIAFGKERFLTHPLIEVFLKLKWYRTWKFYLLYILTYFAFLAALCAFALAHLGSYDNYDLGTRSVWWHGLAFTHCYTAIMALSTCFELIKALATKRANHDGWAEAARRGLDTLVSLARASSVPVLSGVILYLPVSEATVRYCTAICVILTCTFFMGIISRLPGVGLYVHMLSKVMVTVLNFFATYFWTFFGYAIAFHVLLPGTGPYSTFGDSFVKVLTMLMGEYDYTITFVNTDNPSWVAKIIFIVFVVDMSVVLMNLVLGLAISDIEELQKNSAVRRMIQETYTVMFINGVLTIIAHMPGLKKLLDSVRITGERTCSFKDVYYLDLIDLDPNPSNRLAMEAYPEEPLFYPCPHHIVTNVAKIIKKRLASNKSEERARQNNGSNGMESLMATLLAEMSMLKSAQKNDVVTDENDSSTPTEPGQNLIKVVEKMMLCQKVSTTFKSKKQKQRFLSQDEGDDSLEEED